MSPAEEEKAKVKVQLAEVARLTAGGSDFYSRNPKHPTSAKVVFVTFIIDHQVHL